MRQRTSVQSAQQSGGTSTGTGWRSLRRSSLTTVALVLLTIAVVGGVGVAGAASGTAGAADADAASVGALGDDATLDAEIEYIDDPSADTVTVDPSRESIGFTGFGSSDASTAGLSHLEFEWTAGENASGSLTTTGNYSTDFFASYELGPEDAGSSFDVHLTITDENGTTATDSFTVHVTENDTDTENLAPTASVVWADDPSVERPVVTTDDGTVRLSAADSTDPDGSADGLAYDWELSPMAAGNATREDGGAVLAYDVAPEDEGRALSFAVTVTDPEGANDTMAITVDVAASAEPTSPTAGIDPLDAANTDPITVGADRTSIDFSGFDSTNPNGELSALDFEWSLDGNASGQFVTSGEYPDEWFTTYELGPDDAGATFDVVLTVTAPDGTTDTDSVTVSVDPEADGEPPTANVTWPDDPTAQQVTVDPSVESFLLSPESTVDPNYDLANLTLDWSVESDAAGELNVSEEPYAVYHPSNADRGETLTFTLEATNEDGYSDTDTIDVTFEADDADPPTAVLDALDAPGDAEIDVHPDNESVSFSAFASSDPQYQFNELEFEWAVVGNASGDLVGADAYDEDWYATYELGSDDADSSFDVELTVINAAGKADTAAVTVNVAAGGNQTDDGDDEDGNDDDPGGSGPIPIPSNNDDGTDADDPAPAPFSFSFESSTDSVVLTGENARAGSSAGLDLAVVLGALQLEHFEGEAAEDAESFEVTISTSDRSGPDVDGEVVQVLDVEDEDMLAAGTLDFGVASSASDADAGDATIYEYRDGEWHESDGAADGESMTTDVADAAALAVVSQSSGDESTPADDGDDDGDDGGIGTIAIVLLLGVLVVVGGVEYYRRQ